MAKVTAILLAAGMSRRMGANKLFLAYKDKPIVQHVLETIKRIRVDERVVVSSEISIDKLRDLIDSDMVLIDNPEYQTGMTSSIKAGVKHANPEHGVMICLADQPLITVENYDQCLDTYQREIQKDEKVIVVPYSGNTKGNPVIFSPFWRQAILDHSAPEGCKEIIQVNKSHVVRVDLENDGIVIDVDTPESYRHLIGKK